MKQDNMENYKLQEELKKMIFEEPPIPMHVIYDIIRSQDPDDISMDV